MCTKGLKVPQSGARTPEIVVAVRLYVLKIVARRVLLVVGYL
jgi:hypothetical protein